MKMNCTVSGLQTALPSSKFAKLTFQGHVEDFLATGFRLMVSTILEKIVHNSEQAF